MRGVCKQTIDCSMAEAGSFAWLFAVIQADNGLLQLLVGSADAIGRRVARSIVRSLGRFGGCKQDRGRLAGDGGFQGG